MQIRNKKRFTSKNTQQAENLNGLFRQLMTRRLVRTRIATVMRARMQLIVSGANHYKCARAH